jgi:indolepyruvate ferredoxin oxidoreductase alpha subunit
VRIRACHVRGSFRTKTNQRPAMSVKDALEAPRRDFLPHRPAARELPP